MNEKPILDEMWSILGPVDIKDFEVVAGPAEPERYAAYEAKVGFRLPDAFRELTLSKLGGILVTAREELWPEAKLYDVGPAWTFWRGVAVFGLNAEVPDWLNLELALDRVRDEDVIDFAPVLKIQGSGWLYGFRPDQTIAVYDGYELADDEAGSFRELYKREIDGLLERLKDMKALQAKRAAK